MLDIRRLQVLAAVVDTGSVTAAATRLGYTPSSISQQLSTLERETGVALFEKNGRGIRATDADRLNFTQEIYRRVHGLTGAAHLAGLSELAQLAEALEAMLMELKPPALA
mgnify:CR=1 FL=1